MDLTPVHQNSVGQDALLVWKMLVYHHSSTANNLTLFHTFKKVESSSYKYYNYNDAY